MNKSISQWLGDSVLTAGTELIFVDDKFDLKTGGIWEAVEGRNLSWWIGCCKTVSVLRQATNNQQLLELFIECQPHSWCRTWILWDTWDEHKEELSHLWCAGVYSLHATEHGNSHSFLVKVKHVVWNYSGVRLFGIFYTYILWNSFKVMVEVLHSPMRQSAMSFISNSGMWNGMPLWGPVPGHVFICSFITLTWPLTYYRVFLLSLTPNICFFLLLERSKDLS